MALVTDLDEMLPEEPAPTNKVRIGLYFFNPRDFFGWFIVALQWLVGGSWNSPCHMAHSIDKWLFETTTDGTTASNQAGAAFRLADDVLYIMVDEATAFELLEWSALAVEENHWFSWRECVAFCWQLLWADKRTVEMGESLTYAGVTKHLDKLYVTPPFTCTAFVWDVLLEKEKPEWNDFTPAAAYAKILKHIEES